MKLSVAANYDEELADQLAKYPVSEVYGKLGSDIVGGGRPSFMAAPLNWSRLKNYVSRLKDNGIEFNYLLNSSCMGNREFGRSWQSKVTKLLSRIEKAGISRVTVSTPFLLEIIKERFPEMYIRAGIFAQIDTPARARFWNDLGADCLTLESFSINRDFKRLSAIRKSVDCDLQLIANHPCLLNCPMQSYHQNGFAHSSDGSRNLFIDYCFLRCSRKRLQQPANFIKSAWIRPEDTAHYERLGFDNFKLLERNIPSQQLIKRVKAYSDRKSPSNLAELLLPYGFSDPVQRGKLWRLRHFFRPRQIGPAKLKPFHELMKSQGMLYPLDTEPIFIDPAAIPADFINHFEKIDCTTDNCRTCRYCYDIAESAVRTDPGYKARLLGKYQDIESLMRSEKLWKS